jgi:geranylgeranyl reductase family protein
LKYDVAIVGAGPAGSTAAKFICDKKYKVVLIDKNKFPREKPCGGGLTAHVLERFKDIITENMIDSYSYGGITFSKSLKYQIKFTNNKPITAMTIRKKFDYNLVKIAIKAGAKLIEGEKVIDLKINNDKATIKTDKGTIIDSDIIIGADGVWSIVAKKIGLRKKNNPIGLCVFEEYELEKEIIDKYFGELRLGYIHSKFDNLKGYGWVFPKNKHINIGLGELDYNPNKNKGKTNLKNVYNKYITQLKKNKLIPEKIKISNIKGGAFPIIPLKKTYSNRVILVGDAAGFVNPVSGEGIYYAMASGKLAAETIQKALKLKDPSERILSKYQKNWKKDFGKELRLMYWFAKRQRRAKSERNFRLLKNDEKLNQLLSKVMAGNLSFNEYKWKIARRYIYSLIKDFLIKNNSIK